MADDIDDLLDEVETKYVDKKKNAIDTSKRSKPVTRNKLDDDISDLLDDTQFDDQDFKPISPSTQNRGTKSVTSTGQKCYPVFLGGSNHATGLGTTISQRHIPFGERSSDGEERLTDRRKRPVDSGKDYDLGFSSESTTCDQLRCTACDFRVCLFDNYKWASDTNYLFLRNNVPDFAKLKSKLFPSKGQRAYCCQCSWRTIKDMTQLEDPELKWHCGKH